MLRIEPDLPSDVTRLNGTVVHETEVPTVEYIVGCRFLRRCRWNKREHTEQEKDRAKNVRFHLPPPNVTAGAASGSPELGVFRGDTTNRGKLPELNVVQGFAFLIARQATDDNRKRSFARKLLLR